MQNSGRWLHKKNLVVPSATVWKISDQNNQNHLGRLLQSQKEGRSRQGEHSDPAEMPSYSQSPSLHDWRLAVLSFCTRLWRMRRGQSHFSWFHCPVWKYSTKIRCNADVRRLLLAHTPPPGRWRWAQLGESSHLVCHQVNRWSNRWCNRWSRCAQQPVLKLI